MVRYSPRAGEGRLGELKAKFAGLLSGSEHLMKNQPRCPGYPKWYMELCEKPWTPEWDDCLKNLTPSKRVTPMLLRMTWLGMPLHYHDLHKWGYICLQEQLPASSGTRGESFDDSFVAEDCEFPAKAFEQLFEADMRANREAKDVTEGEDDQNALWMDQYSNQQRSHQLDEGGTFYFVKLPHKDGGENNVGNPLAKDFLDKLKDGILATASASGMAGRVLVSAKSVSYWKSSRDRVRDQLVVDCDGSGSGGRNVILPMLVSAGTLTRRAVERTWLTASNAREDRIGSELKTLVEAPPGHAIVGADVDSQELWIAAVLGDAHFSGEHGSTPLGWMTLQGNKADGTDMRSTAAKTVAVSWDNAKVLN